MQPRLVLREPPSGSAKAALVSGLVSAAFVLATIAFISGYSGPDLIGPGAGVCAICAVLAGLLAFIIGIGSVLGDGLHAFSILGLLAPFAALVVGCVLDLGVITTLQAFGVSW